ncbi:metal-dependent hydrolase, partial [Stenotrophomonas maltophilia]
GRIPACLLAAGVVAAMLRDADLLAFSLLIPYADAFVHRGASNSLLFAGLLAALSAVWSAFCKPRLSPTKARPTESST